MQPPNPDRVVDALLLARRESKPVDADALAQDLHMADDAYRVQDLVARALGEPAVHMHWKSGGPGRTSILTHAPLFESGVMTSPADARGRHFNLRLIEAEVALRLAKDVTPGMAAALSHEDAPSLVEAMTVSIEIVDSRWQQGVTAPALLKLADLQSHGALVLGEWRPFESRDWGKQECSVQIGSAAPQVFTGTHSMNDPAWLLPIWLRHATRSGEVVNKGAVVTTGTWCGMLRAQAGDAVHVTFDGIGEASVQL